MEKSLFRKKSLDHISSPEQLHDYMRVTGPRLWMILTAVAVLLAGFLVYASTVTLENTMPIRVQVTNFEESIEIDGEIVSYRASLYAASLPLSRKDTVETGMTVRLSDRRGKVEQIAVGATDGEEVLLIIGMDDPDYTLPDGLYDAELVLETATPISFLWN